MNATRNPLTWLLMRRWGLRARLTIAMAFLGVAALIVVSLIISTATSAQLESRVGNEVQSVARLEGSRLGTVLTDQVRQTMVSVAASEDIIAAVKIGNSSYFTNDEQAILDEILKLDAQWQSGSDAGESLVQLVTSRLAAGELRDYIAQAPLHREVFITDRYGAEVAGSGRTSDYYQADEDWWQVGWNNGQGGIYLGSPEFDESAGILAIDIAVPIIDKDTGEVIGVLKDVYDVTAIVQEVGGYTLGATGHMQVIDAAGKLVAGPGVESIGAPVHVESLLGGRIYLGPGNELNALDYRGEYMVVGYAPITSHGNMPAVDELGWVVTIEQDRAEAFAPVSQLQSALGVITLIAALASVLVAWMIGQSMTQGLSRLMQVSSQLSLGHYDARAQVTSRDEIGELAASLNTMAAAIQTRDADLTDLNQSLIDRTVELEQATREALEASRLKDEFLAVMSHELRTPLNAIIGFLGIMQMTGGLDERNAHMVQRIRANSERLLALINDVLDISRIEAGRLQLIPAEVSLRKLTQRLGDNMSILADQKGLEFTIDIDPDLPPTVLVDEDAITKILSNLLSNAFKFTNQGRVSLEMYGARENLIVEVIDTGMGIPPHMHEVIFERFRQVDGASTRARGGAGLGLAIVQHLCHAMRGSVRVESTVGKGSTFTITLPVLKAALVAVR